jgi:uncharacterized Zn finger protein
MECPSCGEEVDELVTVQAGTKKRRACEECADQLREQAEIADAAETAMQGMMEYKGGRK